MVPGPFSGALYRLRSMASDQDVFAAISRRKALKDRLAEFFAKDIDAILCPIAPVPAFEHLQKLPPLERTLDVDGTTVPYMSMLTWIALATALHAPAAWRFLRGRNARRIADRRSTDRSMELRRSIVRFRERAGRGTGRLQRAGAVNLGARSSPPAIPVSHPHLPVARMPCSREAPPRLCADNMS